MAVTTSEKFGFPIADSGTDPTPDRARWMQIFGSLEGKALAMGVGTLAERPAAPLSPLAWFDSDLKRLSVHPGVGGAWTNVTPLATALPPAGAFGGAGAVGVSSKAAREDHTHPLPAIKRADLPAITTADLPVVDVQHGGTGAAALTAGSFLRGNGTAGVVLRTPAQVLADIGAAAAAAGVPAGGAVGDTLKQTAGGPAWSAPAVTADQVTDATAVGKAVVRAANQAAARTAIGAGTSNFDGSYTALTGKPVTFPPIIGTTAATAMAGDTPIPATAADVQAVAIATGMVVVDHGTDGSVARPAGVKLVTWRGPVEPVNAVTGDWWDDKFGAV